MKIQKMTGNDKGRLEKMAGDVLAGIFIPRRKEPWKDKEAQHSWQKEAQIRF